MKNTKFFLTLILFASFIVSCSNDDIDTAVVGLAGDYKIVEMKSSVPVDMNNNGMKSDDVLGEVTSPYVINGSSNPGIYYINNVPAMTAYDRQMNKGSVSIPYPFQHVIYGGGESGILSLYVMQFVGFSYRVSLDNEIEILDISSDYQFADYGVASSVKRIDDNSFIVTISAKLYDFKENKWIAAQVDIKLQKD